MYACTPHRSRRQRVVALVTALFTMGAGTAIAAAGVSPQTVDESADPGTTVDVAKTVETPEIPPNPDIVFLADTTTSMTASIANVQANAGSVLAQILASQPSAQFAVADYKDVDDFAGAHLDLGQDLTADTTAVQNAINAWTPLSGGGTDAPEDWIGALGSIPTAVSFRAEGEPIVVMFGDSSSHDPSAGFTLASATAALQAAGVRVIAIAVPGADGFLWNGLDSAGQASIVTSQTGGTLSSADPSQVANTILAQLQNLPATVTTSTSCDDPSVTVTLTPTSPTTVTSGASVTYDESIVVGSDAPQGGTVTCTATFLVNGEVPSGDFVQTITIDVNDITPPVVTVESKVVEATGPGGAVVPYASSALDNVDGPLPTSCVPPSGSLFPLGITATTCTATDSSDNTGVGFGTIEVVDTTPPDVTCAPGPNPGGKTPKASNQDGFFTLGAIDLVDPDPVIFVTDTGSGTVFGPFTDGTEIKYVEAPGATPKVRTHRSGIVFITGTADAAVTAVDFSGNVGGPVDCLVPPPPA